MSTVSSRFLAHRGRGIWLFATRLDADSTGALSVYYRTKRRPRCARGHCALSRTKPVHVHEPCSSLRERCVPHIGLRRSAAIHVHRRSARVIRLQACNDLTKTARCGVLEMCNIVLYQTLNQTMHVHEPCSGLRERSPTYVHLACLTLICDDQQLYTDAAIRRRS